MAPELMASPRTMVLVLTVMVFWAVAVPVAMAGRAMVPAGGLMPMIVSNDVPATCWPMSHSPVLRTRPLV